MAALTHIRVRRAAKARVLPVGRLLRCAGWVSVVAAMGLLHVFVQFTMSDLRIGARQLQCERERLENEASRLRVGLGNLEGRERIDQLARQWGMGEPKPSQIETLRMPSALAAKYETRPWRRQLHFLEEDSARRARGNPLTRIVAGIAELGGDNAYANASASAGAGASAGARD